jgi:hypothetical protein
MMPVMEIGRGLIGVCARLMMWACIVVIVGDAATTLWQRGEHGLAFFSVVLFPATTFIWPWIHDAFGLPLWIAGIVALAAYPISTFVGGLPPVERPGDL